MAASASATSATSATDRTRAAPTPARTTDMSSKPNSDSRANTLGARLPYTGALMLLAALGVSLLPFGPGEHSLCATETLSDRHLGAITLTLHANPNALANPNTSDTAALFNASAAPRSAVLPGQYASTHVSVRNLGGRALDGGSLVLQPYSFRRPLPHGATVHLCEEIECPLMRGEIAHLVLWWHVPAWLPSRLPVGLKATLTGKDGAVEACAQIHTAVTSDQTRIDDALTHQALMPPSPPPPPPPSAPAPPPGTSGRSLPPGPPVAPRSPPPAALLVAGSLWLVTLVSALALIAGCACAAAAGAGGLFKRRVERLRGVGFERLVEEGGEGAWKTPKPRMTTPVDEEGLGSSPSSGGGPDSGGSNEGRADEGRANAPADGRSNGGGAYDQLELDRQLAATFMMAPCDHPYGAFRTHMLHEEARRSQRHSSASHCESAEMQRESEAL